MKLLPLIAVCAVVYAGCSQKKGISPTRPLKSSEQAVILRSEVLLQAASDFELWRNRPNNAAAILNRSPNTGTNPYCVWYYNEEGYNFTNWLAHSRPALFDKFWVHWEGNKPLHHSWIRPDYGTGVVAIVPFPTEPTRFIESSNVIVRGLAMGIVPTQTYGIVLAWDPSLSSNVAYSVYSGPDDQTYTNMLSVGTNLSATITGLLPGTTVHFVAVATDTNGNQSIPSNEVIYNVPVLPPTPPTNLRITTLVAASVSGPWQPLSNAPPVIVDGTDTNAVYKLQIEKVEQ